MSRSVLTAQMKPYPLGVRSKYGGLTETNPCLTSARVMQKCSIYTTTGLVIAMLITRAAYGAETLTFVDPKGDDNGSGKMTYPTNKAYTPGSFDIVKLEIREDGED